MLASSMLVHILVPSKFSTPDASMTEGDARSMVPTKKSPAIEVLLNNDSNVMTGMVEPQAISQGVEGGTPECLSHFWLLFLK
jgi:hypothetical protein